MKFNKFLLISFMFLIIMWGISSSSWFAIWMALEMNNMMIIPLMMMTPSQQFIESTFKYFLIQAISSMIFIMMSFSMNIFSNYMLNFLMPKKIMMLSMMFKIGMFPFFMWYLDIINKTNYSVIKLIMTTQKILPMLIISMLMTKYDKLDLILLGMNALIGSIIALNQTNMKKIMALSSITQMSWMMLSISMSYSIFLVYFMIYSMLLFIIISFIEYYLIKSINQLSYNMNIFMSMNILSLSGLPPFSGFIIKWLILDLMMKNQMIMLSVIMMLSSIISLYFYFRLIMFSFMLNSIKMKWMYKINYKTNFFNFLSMINLMAMPFLLGMYTLN